MSANFSSMSEKEDISEIITYLGNDMRREEKNILNWQEHATQSAMKEIVAGAHTASNRACACVGLHHSLMLFTLEARVRAITVSSVNPQFTATLHCFFTNDSVSES